MATMHGVILGPLTEVYPDRIVVGARTLFLRDGEACRYEIGMGLEVIFTEQATGAGACSASRPSNPASASVRVHWQVHREPDSKLDRWLIWSAR